MVIIQKENEKSEKAEEAVFERELLNRDFEKEYPFGIAVDLGSTTIEVVAIDFRNRKIFGKTKERNVQSAYGADVMMRIMHGMRGMQNTLHEMLCKQIENMSYEIMQEASSTEIWKRTSEEGNGLLFFVVGNPTMTHYFLGKDVTGLGVAPFLHAYRGKVLCSGKDLGFEKYPQAKIKVMPLIRGHVGGDALALIGRKELYRKDKISLAIDMGTNAEMILSKYGEIQACSTASGPALEGKGIQCGMLAKNGAVTDVKLAKNTGNITIQVIGEDAPKGVCGSGLLHLIGELLRTKILQRDGYLPSYQEREKYGIPEKMATRLVERKGQRAFLLCSEQENERELYLLQEDIRNIQTALSAMKTGMEILIKKSGIKLEQIEEVLVAGALGERIREASLLETGLFPKEWSGKIYAIGNAAKQGAMLGLVCGTFINEMEQLVKQIEHIELADSTCFQNMYLRNMDFKI